MNTKKTLIATAIGTGLLVAQPAHAVLTQDKLGHAAFTSNHANFTLLPETGWNCSRGQ